MAPEKNGPSLAELDDIAYPVMIADLSSGAGAPGIQTIPTGTPGGRSLGVTAQNAIADVLGWRWRPEGNPNDLVNALNQTFKPLPRQGRVDYLYSPRTFSGTVQADMGTITGAQASLATRADMIVQPMLQLLDGIAPLLPDPDPGDLDAIRSLLRSELQGIVAQFHAEGGPNIQLVDDTFRLIGGNAWDVELGGSHSPGTYETVAGHLGRFRDAYGMTPEWVNTIPEEQNLTNFMVFFDYARDLYNSWRADRKFFRAGSSPFLGTQLIQISRALAWVSEAVQETSFILDSVLIGRGERQTLLLTFPRPNGSMFLADLLSWVERFATEGPQTIADSGKDGVEAFTSTARRLAQLVQWSAPKTPGGKGNQNPGALPKGFLTDRVQNSLSKLGKALQEVAGQCDQIRRFPPPTITFAEISRTWGGRNVLNVYGSGFQAGASVSIGVEARSERSEVSLPMDNTTVVGDSSIVASWDAEALTRMLQSDAAVKVLEKIREEGGAFEVSVRNPDGQTAELDMKFPALAAGQSKFEADAGRQEVK